MKKDTKEFILSKDIPQELKNEAITFIPIAESHKEYWLNTQVTPNAVCFYFDNYNGKGFQFAYYRDKIIKSYITTEIFEQDYEHTIKEPSLIDIEQAFNWLKDSNL